MQSRPWLRWLFFTWEKCESLCLKNSRCYAILLIRRDVSFQTCRTCCTSMHFHFVQNAACEAASPVCAVAQCQVDTLAFDVLPLEEVVRTSRESQEILAKYM